MFEQHDVLTQLHAEDFKCSEFRLLCKEDCHLELAIGFSCLFCLLLILATSHCFHATPPQSPSSSLNHPSFLNSSSRAKPLQPPDSWPATVALPTDHLRFALKLPWCFSLLHELPRTPANCNPRHRHSSHHHPVQT